MTTLEAQIAALPEYPQEPQRITTDNAIIYFELRAEAALARLALTRRALQAMVDDCKTCFGNGTMTMPIMYSPTGKPSRPCPRCADARRVLEVTREA